MSTAKDAPEFFALIDAYNRTNKAERVRIDTQIDKEFGIVKAVTAPDMSGFTSIVKKYGAVHYIAMIKRMQDQAEKGVHNNPGKVIKYDADNVARDKSQKIRAKIGIAWGPILLIPGYDLHGDPVNVSYKLGEDLACDGEILVEASAFANLPSRHGFVALDRTFEISNVQIKAHVRSRFMPGSKAEAAATVLGVGRAAYEYAFPKVIMVIEVTRIG